MLFELDIVTAHASLTYCLVHWNDVLHSQVPVDAHATMCTRVHVGRFVLLRDITWSGERLYACELRCEHCGRLVAVRVCVCVRSWLCLDILVPTDALPKIP